MCETEYSYSPMKLALGLDGDIYNFVKEVSIDS